MCESRQPQDGADSAPQPEPRLPVVVGGLGTVAYVTEQCDQWSPRQAERCVRRFGHYGTHEALGGTRWT